MNSCSNASQLANHFAVRLDREQDLPLHESDEAHQA
jgi:hypothetical protein